MPSKKKCNDRLITHSNYSFKKNYSFNIELFIIRLMKPNQNYRWVCLRDQQIKAIRKYIEWMKSHCWCFSFLIKYWLNWIIFFFEITAFWSIIIICYDTRLVSCYIIIYFFLWEKWIHEAKPNLNVSIQMFCIVLIR